MKFCAKICIGVVLCLAAVSSAFPQEKEDGVYTLTKGLAEGPYTWILTDRGMVAPGFIRQPSIGPHLIDQQNEVFRTPIRKRILELLNESGGKFTLISTMLFAGPRQYGGIIILADGRTLQGVLIAEGLVRLDRNWAQNDKFPEGNKKAAIEKFAAEWLELDKAAKADGKGFWKHPQILMHMGWDDDKK